MPKIFKLCLFLKYAKDVTYFDGIDRERMNHPIVRDCRFPQTSATQVCSQASFEFFHSESWEFKLKVCGLDSCIVCELDSLTILRIGWFANSTICLLDSLRIGGFAHWTVVQFAKYTFTYFDKIIVRLTQWKLKKNIIVW